MVNWNELPNDCVFAKIKDKIKEQERQLFIKTAIISFVVFTGVAYMAYYLIKQIVSEIIYILKLWDKWRVLVKHLVVNHVVNTYVIQCIYILSVAIGGK